jgi:hypothetical protein
VFGQGTHYHPPNDVFKWAINVSLRSVALSGWPRRDFRFRGFDGEVSLVKSLFGRENIPRRPSSRAIALRDTVDTCSAALDVDLSSK